MKKKLLFLAIFISGFTVLSQDANNNNNNNASEALKNYFEEERLALHLHTNKTTFIAGEQIWFSAYGFSRSTGLVTTSDHNVNVLLYDSQGNEIGKNLLLISQGSAEGSIALPPSTPSGIYYLKAFTPIMNGFHEDESYIQTIQVLNSEIENEVAISIPSYDLQILPEGGHYVSDIENTCGIKILNNKGKGIFAKNITLVDARKNLVVTNIKTNRLGMGKFVFTPKRGEQYSVLVNVGDSIIQKRLPLAQHKGISLKTQQNYRTGMLQLTLHTNQNTLPHIAGKNMKVVIHKDGTSNIYHVQFEPGYPKIDFKIPNSKLYPGVNTVTVFDENDQPFLERLFFNSKGINYIETEIAETLVKNDTFSYSLQNKLNEKTIKSNLSISILPAVSLANSNKGNIYASAYLKPFLQGYIEEPSHYFSKQDHRKNYELDLLLLNQGWSKYQWNRVFQFNKKPSYYNNSPGIALNGYVSPIDPKDIPVKILLYSEDNKTIQVENLEETLNFQLKNLHITSGSSFNFSALDAEGKPVEALFFYTITPKKKDRESKFITPKGDPFSTSEITVSLFTNEGREQLDEAVVTAKKLKYEKFFPGWDTRIIDNGEKSRGMFRNFMGTYGYYYVPTSTIKAVFGRVTQSADPRNRFFVVIPRVVVDGIPYDPSFIGEALSMQDVDEIYVTRPTASSLNPTAHKSHTFIVFTNGKWRTNTQKSTTRAFKIGNEGFHPEKEFYTPKYDYTSRSFEQYGVLGWVPKVTSDKDGNSIFTIYNPENIAFNVYIEGITEYGTPVSTVTYVPVETEN